MLELLSSLFKILFPSESDVLSSSIGRPLATDTTKFLEANLNGLWMGSE